MPAPTIDAIKGSAAIVDTSAGAQVDTATKADTVKMNSATGVNDQDVGVKAAAKERPEVPNAARFKALKAMAYPTRILATITAVFGFLGWGLPVLVGGAAVAISMYGLETYAAAKLKG